MITKFAFIIICLKLFAIQLILAGLILAVIKSASYYTIFITLGSLLFAVASNCMLAYFVNK